jgi:hypothetical protein
MYRPNFCANCGARIVRLKWYPWTSRSFCDSCSRTLIKHRLRDPLLAALIVLSLGFLLGRSGRPAPPPLLIERSANSPLYQKQDGTTTENTARGNAALSLTSEVIYTCGARTKKGTPCSRRVHGPVRCWQHKGMPAIVPQDKLLVKE